MIRIIRNYGGRDYTFVIGPWMARLNLSGHGSFGWRDTDNPITIWLRKWWTGWHRWDDEIPW